MRTVKEISDLTVTRANSDIKIKSDKITAKIQEIDSKLNNISEKASKNIATLRNYTLRWNASISKLESAKDKVNYQNINNTRDLIKYIDSINENIFNLHIHLYSDIIYMNIKYCKQFMLQNKEDFMRQYLISTDTT